MTTKLPSIAPFLFPHASPFNPWFVPSVRSKLSPILAAEPDRRIAALTSFAYNCGLGNYRISTLRRRVNQRDWPEAAREIMKWNKAAGRVMAGLTRRRAAEAVFLN